MKELTVAEPTVLGSRLRRIASEYPAPHLARWAIEWAFRRLTGRLRRLPDFIIIGAQRAGTTSLHSYLTEHPDVLPSFKKETLFFSNYYGKGLAWYRSHFPLARKRVLGRRTHSQRSVTGEASPYYLFHPHVPRRVAQVLSETKLIAVLRNPVDRAYSHYHHEVRMGYETLSFEDAIEAEESRLAGEISRMFENKHYRSFSHQNHTYLSRGIYVEQLQRWAKFVDRDRILVLRSKDLRDDPGAILEQVEAFIGLPNWRPRAFKRYHHSQYACLQAATRERLIRHFTPHNQRLYEYLGTDLGWER
jgi:hypothetical protein